MFFIVQLLSLVVAFLSSKEEFYATYPYRESIAPKGKMSALYHKWGAAHIAYILLMLGFLAFGFSFMALLTAFIVALWYWLLFDILYALFIKKPWYYLGNESQIDKWLKRNLGVNEGGKTKAYIVGGLIIIINIWYLFVQ